MTPRVGRLFAEQEGKVEMEMKTPKVPATWVVYLMTIHKRVVRMKAVCEQTEWDAMEMSRPGYHQLIRAGIATEVEAEMLARHSATTGTHEPGND